MNEGELLQWHQDATGGEAKAWNWADVRRAIDDSDRQFSAFLVNLPRGEIERLISSNAHWCNVVGHFDIDNDRAAKTIYDEIKARARDGRY